MDLQKLHALSQSAQNDTIMTTAINVLPDIMRENPAFTPVKTLAARAGIPHNEAIRVAKQFQDAGLGRLFLGRRGKPTRFEWSNGEDLPPITRKRRAKIAHDTTLTFVEFSSGRSALLPQNLQPDEIWELVRHAAKAA